MNSHSSSDPSGGTPQLTAPRLTISPTRLPAFVDGLCEMAHRLPLARLLVGIAGIPGSGKSTLAELIHQELHRRDPDIARILPMDGYHLPNDQLDRLKLRPLKGLPPTYNPQAFIDALRLARLRVQAFNFPLYDRDLHDIVLRDTPQQRIDRAVRIVLTEGNFLLLRDPPWSQIAPLLQFSLMLDTDPALARERLLARHQRGGRSPDDALAHYLRVDEPNTRLVLERSTAPRFVLHWLDE